jgi:flagellar assembly protein FliH
LSSLKMSADPEKRSWQKYEISPFGKTPDAGVRGGKAFIAFQKEDRLQSDFIPIAPGHDRENLTGQDILETFQEKTTLIEQEAYEKGFEQGEKDGFEIGEKRAVKIVDNIEHLFVEMTQLKETILKRHEKEIIDIIFEIVEAIVHKEVQDGGHVIGDAIVNALELANDTREIQLRVNPDDYAFIENARPELFSRFKDIRSIIVNSDPSLSKGGCILETPKGGIDASIETRLKKIQECLLEAFADGAHE